ncbi:MAG: hypothetical protein L6R40_001644 [Gallowayella cf. fulva]|nr:MAG: hypothetical protein L6R40_001644 [Xanthomendoza cf. fulva]
MAKRSREDSPPAGATDTLSPSSLSSDPGAPFISAASNEIRSSKYLQVTDEPAGASVAMKCSLAPHPETITFNTFEDFEVHYAQNHSNRCSECHKNFPTEHFLGLHISENHDPLVAARKAREEKTYRCFVEGCDKVCSTPQKRRMHLQAKHSFPKQYDFYIVNNGIDKRSSMLRTQHRRGSSAASRALHRNHKPAGLDLQPSFTKGTDQVLQHDSPPESSPAITEEGPASTLPTSPNRDVDDLTSTMSALRFVPPSVRFGRGGRAAGFSRQ